MLIRWADTIGPETVQALSDWVVQFARSLKVTRGVSHSASGVRPSEDSSFGVPRGGSTAGILARFGVIDRSGSP